MVIVTVTVLAGPAKRNCPQLKCFNATNDCEVSFGQYVLILLITYKGSTTNTDQLLGRMCTARKRSSSIHGPGLQSFIR
jgi:hypothetical protein